MESRFILAIFIGTLSVGHDKVLSGDTQLALAAHHYYAQYGAKQSNVMPFKPKPIDYGYIDKGRLYNIVGYVVRDTNELEDWWYDSN